MTALVPTKGHEALIEFAMTFCSHVTLVISSRSHEPVSGQERCKSFKEKFPGLVVKHHQDDSAVQNPETEEEWAYWARLCWPCDYIIASEDYAKRLALMIGAEYIPFDPKREVFKIKGTDQREKLPNTSNLMSTFIKSIQKKIVLFGQESTGKTTMTKFLGTWLEGVTTPEWARTYLESLGDKRVTPEKMRTIAKGQYALMQAAYTRTDNMFFFHDTDLLSTIGYGRIYDGVDYGKELFRPADLYIVMNDEIPFEEDALRYGGKVRESTKQFWIDLLEEYKCKYYVVKGVTPGEQHEEILGLLEPMFQPIRDFVRE